MDRTPLFQTGHREQLRTASVMLNARVPLGLVAAFDERAALDGRSRSAALRYLIRLYVAGLHNEERRPGRGGAQELMETPTIAEGPRCST